MNYFKLFFSSTGMGSVDYIKMFSTICMVVGAISIFPCYNFGGFGLAFGSLFSFLTIGFLLLALSEIIVRLERICINTNIEEDEN